MPISSLALPEQKRAELANEFGHVLESLSFVAVNCVAEPKANYDAQVWFAAENGAPVTRETKRRWALRVILRDDVDAIYTDSEKRRLDEALRRMATALGQPSGGN